MCFSCLGTAHQSRPEAEAMAAVMHQCLWHVVVVVMVMVMVYLPISQLVGPPGPSSRSA